MAISTLKLPHGAEGEEAAVDGTSPQGGLGKEAQVLLFLRPLQVSLSFLLHPTQGLNLGLLLEITGRKAVWLLA